jgi:hypothetical protein
VTAGNRRRSPDEAGPVPSTGPDEATPATAVRQPRSSSGAMRTRVRGRIPHAVAFDFVGTLRALKRRAVPGDAAPAVTFLAAEEAGRATGSTAKVDGGHIRHWRNPAESNDGTD